MQELVVQVKVGLLMCKDGGYDSVDDANIHARLALSTSYFSLSAIVSAALVVQHLSPHTPQKHRDRFISSTHTRSLGEGGAGETHSLSSFWLRECSL